MTFSTRLEKKVTILNAKPNAQVLLDLLKNHSDETDTSLSEWAVDVECKVNDLSSTILAPTQRYRWEITLTRNIK